jgi:site-specific recombinase XerD
VELQDALSKFLEDRNHRCTPRIVKWYASHINLFVQWLAERNVTALESVTTEHIHQFIASLRNRECLNRKGKLSPITIHKRALAIRTFFHWAFKLKLTPSNPATSMIIPKVGRRLPKALTPAQVSTLLATQMDARERAVIMLILDSGLRLSEAANLELGDLDLERRVAHVRCGKGDKERYVVFGEDTCGALEAWLSQRYASFGEKAVFIGLQGKLTSMGLYKLIKRVAERAGITLHPHMLRHTFATSYLDAGGSIVDLRDLLGHTDIKTTTIYLGVSLDRLREKHKTLSPVSRMANRGGQQE